MKNLGISLTWTQEGKVAELSSWSYVADYKGAVDRQKAIDQCEKAIEKFNEIIERDKIMAEEYGVKTTNYILADGSEMEIIIRKKK